MTTTADAIAQTALATQTYHIFVKATPEAIWAAITQPDMSQQYFYGARIENTPERHYSTGPDGSLWGDSPTLEFDPPRRLVHDWQSLYSPELAAELPSRVTWDIEAQEGGISCLTLVHDQLEHSPKTASSVAGKGWMIVLSGLKTLLETGQPLTA
jgi:uncharacterized protein YndB with AHSA1/START domain